VLLVVVLVSVLTGGGADDDPVATPATQPRESSPAAEEPTGEAETGPETLSLDEAAYLDRPRDEVKRELEQLGLKVKDEKVENLGGEAEGTVAALSPTDGLVEGDEVTLSVWGPEPKVDEKHDGDHEKPGKSKGRGKGKKG
jgi:serine/threonine-protein kinase